LAGPTASRPQQARARGLPGGAGYLEEAGPATSGGCRASTPRREPGLAQVDPMLEQAAEAFAGQADLFALGTLDPKDLHRLVHAAVTAAIAFGLAQRPQPSHPARD